jgi:predicted nucleic acid-binding protein
LSEKLRVVFDINVWVDTFISEKSSYPFLPVVPPTGESPAADCVSLAFDGDRFQVYGSSHILTNVHRVLRMVGTQEENCLAAIEDLVDIIHFSGGSIVDPDREAVKQRDFEDNLILDLAKATGADVVVTSDVEFMQSSGWKGIAIISPSVFLRLALTVPGSD